MKYFLLLLLSASVVLARRFNATDLVAIRRVQSPAMSPDGSRFVVPVNVLNSTTNKKTQNLWLGTVASYKTVPLPDLTPLAPFVGSSDSEPFWSADGSTVFFLSNRAGSNDLWAVKPQLGAQAQRVTTFPVDIDSVHLSPDGKRIAFSALVYPGLSMAQTVARDNDAKAGPDMMKFSGLFIRRWDEWWVGKFRHLFIAPLLGGGSESYRIDPTSAIDLMPSFEGDTPSRPFGGAEEFDWSPDSSQLAFTTQLGRDKAWSTDLNVWLVEAYAGAMPRCITSANTATDTSPAYSPDGKWIAYLAMQIPAYESDLFDIMFSPLTPL